MKLSDETLDLIFDSIRPVLVRKINSCIHNTDVSEDIVQETLLRFIEHNNLLHGNTVDGWLQRVAHNLMVDYLRDNHRKLESSISESDAVDTANQLSKAEDLVRCKDVMDNMPEFYQTVLTKRIVEEKTYAEIAKELQVGVKYVPDLIKLAKENFKERFGYVPTGY